MISYDIVVRNQHLLIDVVKKASTYRYPTGLEICRNDGPFLILWYT